MDEDVSETKGLTWDSLGDVSVLYRSRILSSRKVGNDR